MILVAGILTVGFLAVKRYASNPEQIVPLPFRFLVPAPAIKLEAPILIIGDRMGNYFGRFKAELASVISSDLDRPIKIQSLAQDGQGLHRTLHQMRSINQWPQLLIYQGGSEEFGEKKFELSEIKKISVNFKRFKDERIETVLILYPWLSRLVYEPLKRVRLEETPVEFAVESQVEYLRRLDTELMLYEEQLIQLVNLSKDRSSLLILATTPINLDIPPRSVCEFATTTELETDIQQLRELLKANDPKGAYARSSKLVGLHSGNAGLYYIHGQISKRLGYLEEAKANLLSASAYDCDPWRTTEIQNAIIRKVASNRRVLLFDFARLVENDWTLNQTFFDELHPQNLYYDKGMQQLGLVIKNILKL